MVNLSKFAERLNELKFDNGEMNGKQLAEAVGVAAPTITQYLKAKHTPNIKNLVLLADYFHCSTDYLLGLEEETTQNCFKPCPLFSEQIANLVKYFNLKQKEFYEKAGIPESSFFEWKDGTSVPTLDSIIKMAENLNCRVDFILGRE